MHTAVGCELASRCEKSGAVIRRKFYIRFRMRTKMC